MDSLFKGYGETVGNIIASIFSAVLSVVAITIAVEVLKAPLLTVVLLFVFTDNALIQREIRSLRKAIAPKE